MTPVLGNIWSEFFLSGYMGWVINAALLRLSERPVMSLLRLRYDFSSLNPWPEATDRITGTFLPFKIE